MALFSDWDDLNKNGKEGDWCFYDYKDSLYIAFRIPRNNEGLSPEYIEAFPGESEMHQIPICTGVKVPDKWLWDGNRESPTISPSINIVGQWHGYLRAGKLETA